MKTICVWKAILISRHLSQHDIQLEELKNLTKNNRIGKEGKLLFSCFDRRLSIAIYFSFWFFSFFCLFHICVCVCKVFFFQIYLLLISVVFRHRFLVWLFSQAIIFIYCCCECATNTCEMVKKKT